MRVVKDTRQQIMTWSFLIKYEKKINIQQTNIVKDLKRNLKVNI